jgi:hypothetical protein
MPSGELDTTDKLPSALEVTLSNPNQLMPAGELKTSAVEPYELLGALVL